MSVLKKILIFLMISLFFLGGCSDSSSLKSSLKGRWETERLERAYYLDITDNQIQLFHVAKQKVVVYYEYKVISDSRILITKEKVDNDDARDMSRDMSLEVDVKFRMNNRILSFSRVDRDEEFLPDEDEEWEYVSKLD